MDFYLTSLGLGAVGLLAMAFSGVFHQGHGDAGHAGHAHGGHAHGGHTNGGHAGHGHAGHGHGNDTTHGQHGHGSHESSSISQLALALMSPRVLFSLALGLGAAGVLLRSVFTGPLLFAAALAGGVLFERILVTPLWNLGFKFASAPALTLESATGGDATAVTSFDANGQGLISVEVDGQMLQLLGTLHANDRALRARVIAGTRLRVEDVDAARNRCTVSVQ